MFFLKLSKTLKESGVEVVSGNLKKIVENLKAKDGEHIWLSGGSLAKSFIEKNWLTKFISESRLSCSVREFCFSPN